MLPWLLVISMLGLRIWGDSSWIGIQTENTSEELSNVSHKFVSGVTAMVSRQEWGTGAGGCRAQLTIPVDFLVIHHIPGLDCHNQTTCSQRLQELRSHHMGNGWCDVAYNFLVGDDGRLYEGVGWNVPGWHTQGYSNISLGFAFFGSKIACPNIVTRSTWEARSSYCPKMNLPAKYVIIIHTSGRTCSESAECCSLVRDIQSLFMDRFDSCDIGHNFLVGQDGSIYEGTGWNVQGSHTDGYNDIALGIAFMGTFTDIPPNVAALEAAQSLIRCATDKGYLTPNYLLVGHSDVKNTPSPGKALYNIISSWPHFKY